MALQHEDYFIGFKEGDETALNYVYDCYYRPLFHHGRRIVNDEFAVSCIVQEAFLKGWQFRETMENMRHIYCFIRQDVNWKCYAYLNNPSNRFHRNLVGDGAIEKYSDYFFDCQAEDVNFFDEEKLKVIEEALPYLPANRQTIMTLYFKSGLSYKKIARRFGTSNQAISMEVQKSLESLKKIVHAQKKLNAKTVAKSPRTEGFDNQKMSTALNSAFVKEKDFLPLTRIPKRKLDLILHYPLLLEIKYSKRNPGSSFFYKRHQFFLFQYHKNFQLANKLIGSALSLIQSQYAKKKRNPE